MSRTDRLVQAILSGDLDIPESGDILVIRGASGLLADVVEPVRLIFEQSFRPTHDALGRAGLRVTPCAEGPAMLAVVTLTRSRAENLGNVARALALLPCGATLVLDGAKTDGVDSLARQVGAALPLSGRYAKSHGLLAWLIRPAILPAAVAEWAAGAAPSRNSDGHLTAPGLFSPEGPDPGSRRLAAALDGRLKGRVADLGAGWGWLASEALARCPAITAIDLFDAEARAVDCARANVADPRATFHWADVRILGKPAESYDAVIANPPFHQGRAAEPDIGAAFIAAAARVMKASGRLLMVANRQLPYEAALDVAFARWERLSEDKLYKVLAADRPRKPASPIRPRGDR